MIRPFIATLLLGCAPLLAGAQESALAEVSGSGQLSEFEFDIPSQPLQSAIDRFSDVSGVSVVYLGTLVVGRQSAAVKGRYSPGQALSLLVGGQDLAVKRTTPEAFVLMQADKSNKQAREAPAALQAPAGNAAAYPGYYGTVQARLREALCRDARVAPDDFRAALQFWVDPAGRVAAVRLLASTGDGERDAVIVQVLHAMRLRPPPAGFEQPITLLVVPRTPASGVECHAG